MFYRSMVCCSSNGSIQEWSMAHKIKNIRFLSQLWEHNSWITGVVGQYQPTESPCVTRIVLRVNM
ncbi:unnamed protein product [Choristocarpus tenellus]